MPYDATGQGPSGEMCENSHQSDHSDEKRHNQGSCPTTYILGAYHKSFTQTKNSTAREMEKTKVIFRWTK